MLGLVFTTLLTAGLANVSTNPAQIFGLAAAKAHQLGGCVANRGTFHAQLYTSRHHLYVLLMGAC